MDRDLISADDIKRLKSAVLHMNESLNHLELFMNSIFPQLIGEKGLKAGLKKWADEAYKMKSIRILFNYVPGFIKTDNSREEIKLFRLIVYLTEIGIDLMHIHKVVFFLKKNKKFMLFSVKFYSTVQNNMALQEMNSATQKNIFDQLKHLDGTVVRLNASLKNPEFLISFRSGN